MAPAGPVSVPILVLVIVVLLLCSTTVVPIPAAPAAGVPSSTAQLVGELAVHPLARLMMLFPSDGVCPLRAGALLQNATLQPIFAAVNRCESR